MIMAVVAVVVITVVEEARTKVAEEAQALYQAMVL